MGDEEYIGPFRRAPDELLDQVGLPLERVLVVAGLLGEPEPEEVGGDHAVLGLLIEEEAPVVGARWEAVEDEKWIAAAAPEHVDAAAAELLLAPALAPRGNPGGQQASRVLRPAATRARRPGSAPRRDHPWPGRPRRSTFRRRGAPGTQG